MVQKRILVCDDEPGIRKTLAEILEDDSFNQVKQVVYIFGGVDKDNPRCELQITKTELPSQPKA